jgi:hypothetical protein
MTKQTRIRNSLWLAALGVVAALYLTLQYRVNAMHSAVEGAELQIAQLQDRNNLLEAEFQVRSNQVRLGQINQLDLGLSAPGAEQFLDGERGLAMLGGPRAEGAPEPIRVAGHATGEDAPPFPQLEAQGPAPAAVSADTSRLTVVLADSRVRVALPDAATAAR